MPILKSLFSNEGAFFVDQNVVISFPLWRGIKGEDVLASLIKVC
jgi:hypothetical protein